MKSIAITILGILMSATLVANSINTIPPKGDGNKQVTITQISSSTDEIIELQREILNNEDQIKAYEVFIKIDGPDPIYLVEVERLGIEIDEMEAKIGDLSNNK
ncbi:MAG: hypothetical protein JXL97_16040 [Bacteroidales bacterium]|nr:hypothetical protein [Bacteroidales bacterium]